jgi:rRNA maturation endonuclease Nob1
MAYCSNCGEKLPKDADFCPNCGTKTMRDPRINTPSNGEEIRQAFERMSVEMEKAFAIAAKEIQNAFQKARENMQKTTTNAQIVCSNCNEKNPGESVYCYSCGKQLVTEEKEKKA